MSPTGCGAVIIDSKLRLPVGAMLQSDDLQRGHKQLCKLARTRSEGCLDTCFEEAMITDCSRREAVNHIIVHPPLRRKGLKRHISVMG